MSEPAEPGRSSIARLWCGRTPASKADTYVEFLHRRGLPDYRATEGNRGAELLVRVDGEVAEFLLVSYWENYAAIRRFAGSDPERAIYYPEDDDFLLEKEATVTHFEVRG